MDLLSFLSQIRPVGLSPKCLRTRGQLEHPTTSQGVILTRPRARVLQNPTSHRVGILPTGQFGPDLKIDAQNIDLRTVRPGTRPGRSKSRHRSPDRSISRHRSLGRSTSRTDRRTSRQRSSGRSSRRHSRNRSVRHRSSRRTSRS